MHWRSNYRIYLCGTRSRVYIAYVHTIHGIARKYPLDHLLSVADEFNVRYINLSDYGRLAPVDKVSLSARYSPGSLLARVR